MIKCLIVDDEPIAIDILRTYIADLEGIEIVKECKNAIEAGNFLSKNTCDLIFLDIQMPQLSGLSFLKSLVNPPKIIITTAHREYALEGFDLNVVDYLLKPIAFERFLKAVNRIRTPEGKSESLNTVENGNNEHYFYIKSGNILMKVHVEDILYIESISNYVKLFLKDDKTIVSYQSMGYLETMLPSSSFLRIHRSFIVSLSKISAFGGNYVLINKKELPVSNSYKEKLSILIDKRKL